MVCFVGWMANPFAGLCYKKMSFLISSCVNTCKIYDLVHLVITESHFVGETRWHDSCHNTGWWRRRGSNGKTAGGKLTEWKGLKGSKGGVRRREEGKGWSSEEERRVTEREGAGESFCVYVCVCVRERERERVREKLMMSHWGSSLSHFLTANTWTDCFTASK